MENKSKFVSLKQVLPILSFFLCTTFFSAAQTSRGPIAEVKAKMVKLYPNPATSYITFEFQKDQQKGLTVVIFNFLGKKMHETQNLSEKTTVTLTDFNRGMYVYHLIDASGRVVDSGKFQVSQ